MDISIDKETLQEVKVFLDKGWLVQLMNKKGLSFSAMAFILQSLMNATRDAAAAMGEDESSDLG